MPSSRRIGLQAEDQVAEHLIGKGMTIVTRRYKARHGEIDLVAMDGETLVFVEVKYRTGRSALAEEAVSAVKRAAMVLAVQQYLQETDNLERAVRFDVVAVQGNELRHHEDAFRAGD